MADDRCWVCDHPRSWHTERYLRNGPCGCPLPCECVQFSEPPETTVYVAPPGVPDAFRAFGPGTTEGGRAEAGWLPAGRILGPGPDIHSDAAEAAVDGWEPGRVIRSRRP